METRIALSAQKSQRGTQPNLAMKFRRSVKRHLPKITSRRSEQTIGSTESEAQRPTNELSRVAEVTKIETSKIKNEVVNDTRSKTSESQPRSSTEDK